MSPSEVLCAGRKLALGLDAENSTSLSSVIEPKLDLQIPTWRNNGAIKDHPIHGMISRVGGFPASLARYFIACYTRPGEVVLDPFCGKGTALLESVSMGRPAIGGDIAPDAVIVSRAKCLPVDLPFVSRYIENLPTDRVVDLSTVPDDVAIFFSRGTLKQLLSIRQQLFEDMRNGPKQDVATFVCAITLGILHGHSRISLSLPCNQAFAMAPNYVRGYVAEHGLKRPHRDVRKCLLQKAATLLPRPELLAEARVFEASALDCGRYMRRVRRKARLIITSPPYLNRQTYIRDSWLRLWFLKRSREQLRAKTLETGNVLRFIEGLQRLIPAMNEALEARGVAVLVCGQAKIHIAGHDRSVRVGDLCLFALNNSPGGNGFVVERVIMDKKLMNRGSYFAVHRGQTNGADGTQRRRYGEDEILVLRKS